MNHLSDRESWAIHSLGLNRVIVTTFRSAAVIMEVTTAVPVGFFGVNFTTAADGRVWVVDHIAAICRERYTMRVRFFFCKKLDLINFLIRRIKIIHL